MPEPYTIEPPPEKRREISRDRKLDQIIDLLTHRGDDDAGDSGAPEVSFEPDPSQLPTETGDEPEESDADDAGQGEGTANVAGQEKRRFRFPGAIRQGTPR